MSRRIPGYLFHKATGQARVIIAGKTHWLGKHGTPESHERYDNLIGELVATRGNDCHTSISLSEVLAGFWKYAKERYGKFGRGPYGHAVNWRGSIRLLREAYGKQRARDLRPKQVKSLIVDAAGRNGWSRQYANQQLAKVKAIYKWAAAEELVSVEAYQRIAIIEGIRLNASTLPESPPVEPVSDGVVDATIPLLKPVVGDMVRFQRLTGCRPGEVVRMLVDEIDRSGDVWSYSPEHHKTRHHGKSRRIFIGPRAQMILARHLLKTDCSGKFSLTNRRVFEYRIGRGYSTDSYRRAVQRAIERHNRGIRVYLPSWHPNQMRHTAAGELRAEFDIETVAGVLGHSRTNMSELYSGRAEARAKKAVKKLG